MSKQSSLIKFTGKMDGISFYETKNGHFARRANGPSKNRIMTDAKYQRTRENMTEFSSVALAGKLFRKPLQPVATLTDSDLRHRLSKLFRGMLKRSDGIRGQRPVEVSKNLDLLKNVELNSANEFAAICPVKFTAQHNAERFSGTITIEPFAPAQMIAAQPTATHFRLVHLIGTIPDVVYNVATLKHESSDSFFDGLNQITFSDYVSLKSSEPVTLTLEAALQGVPQIGATVSVMQGLGIMFFEQIGTVYYPLRQGNAMKLVDVF